MAGAAVTTKSEVTYYLSDTAADQSGEFNAARVTAMKVGANLVPCIMGVSDIGETPNTIEYSCHGEKATRKIAGTPTIEDFELTLRADFTEAIVNKYDGTALNKAASALVVLTDADGGESYRLVRGRWAGSRLVINEDAPNQLVFTIAPDGIYKLNKA